MKKAKTKLSFKEYQAARESRVWDELAAHLDNLGKRLKKEELTQDNKSHGMFNNPSSHASASFQSPMGSFGISINFNHLNNVYIMNISKSSDGKHKSINVKTDKLSKLTDKVVMKNIGTLNSEQPKPKQTGVKQEPKKSKVGWDDRGPSGRWTLD